MSDRRMLSGLRIWKPYRAITAAVAALAGMVAVAMTQTPDRVIMGEVGLAAAVVAAGSIFLMPVAFIDAFFLLNYFPLSYLPAHAAGPALVASGGFLGAILLRVRAFRQLTKRWRSRSIYLIIGFPILLVVVAAIRTHPLNQYAKIRIAILLGVCVMTLVAGSLHWEHPPYVWMLYLGVPLLLVLNFRPSLFPLKNLILTGHACWITVAAAYYLPALPRSAKLAVLALGLRAVYDIGETGPLVAAGAFGMFAAFEYFYVTTKLGHGRRGASRALSVSVFIAGGIFALRLAVIKFRSKGASGLLAKNTIAQRAATYSYVIRHVSVLGHGLSEIQVPVSGNATLVVSSAHNFLLDFLNVGGIVGFSALVALLVACARRVRIRFGVALLAAILVGLLFSGGVENPELWYVMGACLAGGGRWEQERTERFTA